MNSISRSALVKLVCGIYALIIVVLGVVFAVATSLTAIERVHRYYLEVGLGNITASQRKIRKPRMKGSLQIQS